MVRSRYNVVYTEVPKVEFQFTDHPAPYTNGEATYGSASTKYMGVHKAGAGGVVNISRLDNPGRVDKNAPYLSVHRAKVMDSQWHPFNQSMIATASDDCTIKLSVIPEEFTANVTEAAATLTGHQKKVTLIDWNKSATNILASVSLDRSCKVWDVAAQTEVSGYQVEAQTNFNSCLWSYDGSRVATTAKDGILRLWDPRTPAEERNEYEATAAKKVNKVFWCGKTNYIGTIGQDRTSKREIVIWDLQNMEKPVFKFKPDNASSTSSVAVPHYDADVDILYFFGKGESQVWFGELLGSGKMIAAGRQNLRTPQKGGAWVPKAGLDVMRCEVQRFMKIEARAVVPHSFIFPKKNTDVFHDDVYPDTMIGMPALDGSAWLSGENAMPVLGPLNPETRSQGDGGFAFEAKATYAELEAENAQLKARIAELEAQLA